MPVGCLLIGNTSLGFHQLFPVDASTGLGSSTPPTTIYADRTLSDIFGPSISITAGTILEFRIADNPYAGYNNSGSFTVQSISDTTAPSLSLIPSVTILWPPNHSLQPVTIQANASDNGGGAIILTVEVSSSEPPDTTGDGETIPDYYIDSVNSETGVIELRLRSERSGKGPGRTYTVAITATDESGNQSIAIVEIKAPHDKGAKK
jgi:hypothetical protein